MKKFSLILIGIFLNSCALDKTPKCDQENVKITVLSLLYEDIIQEWNDKFDKNPEKYAPAKQIADELLNTNLTSIITLSVNNELKSCECQATIQLSDEAMNILADEFNKIDQGSVSYLIGFSGKLALLDKLRVDEIIYYDLKTDSEGEIFVELY